MILPAPVVMKRLTGDCWGYDNMEQEVLQVLQTSHV